MTMPAHGCGCSASLRTRRLLMPAVAAAGASSSGCCTLDCTCGWRAPPLGSWSFPCNLASMPIRCHRQVATAPPIISASPAWAQQGMWSILGGQHLFFRRLCSTHWAGRTGGAQPPRAARPLAPRFDTHWVRRVGGAYPPHTARPAPPRCCFIHVACREGGAQPPLPVRPLRLPRLLLLQEAGQARQEEQASAASSSPPSPPATTPLRPPVKEQAAAS